MNSLESLNNISSALIEYTDNRSARAVLDRIIVNNVAQTITDLSFRPRTPVNISEIINYSTAATEVEWVIHNITGSSLLYPTLPAHLTLTQVGDTYTITGLQTEADWQLIKQFTWLLPSNYATQNGWFLETTISYFDEALNYRVEVDWDTYDPRYGYTLSANCAFTMTCTAGKKHSTTSSTLDSEFAMALTQFNIDATTSMTASITKRPIDFASSYGFTGKQGNDFWSTSPLQILDNPNPSYDDDFKITVTAEDDSFSPIATGWMSHPDAVYPDSPQQSIALTALTQTELNAAVSNFTFWPLRTQSTDTMIHVEIEQKYLGTYYTVLDAYIDMIYQGDATLPTTRYLTYNGDATVSVTNQEMLYQPLQFDIIGAGGSGGYQYRGGGSYSSAGGGGGAGAYRRPSAIYVNDSYNTSAYNTLGVEVGIGGAAPTSDGNDGNDGTKSRPLIGSLGLTPGTQISNSHLSEGGLGGKSAGAPPTGTDGDGGDSGASYGTIFPSVGFGGNGFLNPDAIGGGGGGGWWADPTSSNQDGVTPTTNGNAAGGAGFTGVLLGDSVSTTVAVGGFGGDSEFPSSTGLTSSTVNTGAGCGGNGAGGASGQVPTAGRNGEIRIKIGA